MLAFDKGLADDHVHTLVEYWYSFRLSWDNSLQVVIIELLRKEYKLSQKIFSQIEDQLYNQFINGQTIEDVKNLLNCAVLNRFLRMHNQV